MVDAKTEDLKIIKIHEPFLDNNLKEYITYILAEVKETTYLFQINFYY